MTFYDQLTERFGETPEVFVLTLPTACMQCKMTIKWLDKQQYKKYSVQTLDDELLATAHDEYGVVTAPALVFKSGTVAGGFNTPVLKSELGL